MDKRDLAMFAAGVMATLALVVAAMVLLHWLGWPS